MMFWKRISLQKLYRRDNSTKRSRTSRATSDRKDLKLKPLWVGFGDESLLGKQKIDCKNFELNSDRVRKKQRMRGNNEVVDKDAVVDRISELPEPIIHQIFALLSCQKDAVRISILSKKWESMFKSYLTFDFDERHFRVRGEKGKHNRLKAREVQKRKFRNYVEKSVVSRLDPVPCIDKFRLYVHNTNDALEACMGRWIRAAVKKNVKQLDIHVNAKGKKYNFPDDVLLSKSITSLKLSGSLLNSFNAIELCNLRELSIKNANLLSEDLMKKFEQSCPLIEDFRLVSCRGLLHLAISALVKLKRVEVHECGALSCIEIEAPNLETFWYHAKNHQHCKLDLTGCGILKHLTLKDCKMTDTAFQNCISQCPLIEKLVLQECNSLERLTILSGKLTSLALMQCENLQEVNVDAPNLYSFHYSGQSVPLSSMNVLGLREAKFSFDNAVKVPEVVVDYQKLFGYFDWYKGFKLIIYSKQIMTIYEEPKQAGLVRNNFFKLDFTASSTNVLKTVDNWLRECCGRSLTLVSPSSELLKLIRSMIMNREANPNCCKFYLKKCWRHHLADVQMLNLSFTGSAIYNFKWKTDV